MSIGHKLRFAARNRRRTNFLGLAGTHLVARELGIFDLALLGREAREVLKLQEIEKS